MCSIGLLELCFFFVIGWFSKIVVFLMKRDLGVVVIGYCVSNMIVLFFFCFNGDCSDNFENCVWWICYVFSGCVYVEKYIMMI